jgi:hypothetical protein
MRKVILLGAAAALGPIPAAEAEIYKDHETPAYRVELQDGPIEVRSHGSEIVAEVTVAGARRSAINRGYRILAGYISGGNTSSDKIAMTTPVAQFAPSGTFAMTRPVTRPEGDGAWTIRFMVPTEYTLDTLPRPRGGGIRFRRTGPERQVVLRFSGAPSEATLAERVAELRSAAEARGLAIVGTPIFYFYDSPFTLPWNRRNEVAFRLN